MLDLAQKESRNEIITSLLKRCKDHGMQVTTNIDDISMLVDNVTHKVQMAKPSLDEVRMPISGTMGGCCVSNLPRVLFSYTNV